MQIKQTKNAFWGQCPKCGTLNMFEKRGWILPDLLQFGFVCCKRLWLSEANTEQPRNIIEVLLVNTKSLNSKD